MNAIHPVGQHPPQPIAACATQAAPAADGASAAAFSGTSAAAVSGVNSSISATMVQTQVAAMLASIGGGVQSNELLRLMIVLMVLQALLAQDSGAQKAAVGGVMELLGLDPGQQNTLVSLRSATNVVQLQEQSTLLTTGPAALAPTGMGGDPNSSGDQIDFSA